MDDIGCMCEKCNCSKSALLVTSVCNSCLQGNHAETSSLV